MYLDYEKYQELGGTLDETTFKSIAFEAQSFIDWVTFNRLKNETEFPEAVEMCMFNLIQLVIARRNALIAAADDSGTSGSGSGGTVASMSNDGVSVTYSIMSASQLFKNSTNEITEIIHRYLYGVRNSEGKFVTYRGRYADE